MLKENHQKFKILSLFPSDSSYLFYSGTWTVLGKVIFAGLTFLGTLILGNYVSPEQFGSYSYIKAFLGIMIVFTLPGINQAIVRAYAKGFRGSLLYFVKIRLKYSIIGSIILLVIGVWYLLHANTTLAVGFFVSALTLGFLETIMHLISAIAQGKKDFHTGAIASWLYQIILTLTLVPFLFFSFSDISTLSILFLGPVIASVILFFMYQKKFSEANGNFSQKDFQLSRHASLFQFIVDISNNVDKIIIWQFLGPIQTAVYTFALTPIQKIQSLTPFAHIALPKLSEGVWHRSRYRVLLKRFFLLMPLMIMIAGVMVILAPVIFQILLPQYTDSVPVFRWFSLLLLIPPFALFEMLLVAQSRIKDLYISHVIGGSLRIMLMVTGALIWGFYGVVFGFMISEFVKNLLFFYFTHTHFNKENERHEITL